MPAHPVFFDKSLSVGFARQMTQRLPRPVSLTIPSGNEPQELTEAAMALEGLYLFTRHGDWEFEGDEQDHFAVFANCLEQWSTEVLEQIESLQENAGPMGHPRCSGGNAHRWRRFGGKGATPRAMMMSDG